MRRLNFLNKLNSLGAAGIVGSVLTPIIDNRFIPYPYLMAVVVTRQCNSRCQMCSIWKNKTSSHLSLEQFEHIFSQNDFSFVRTLTLTGGEPTLRSDLPQIFDIILKHTPNLERMLLATNGLNTLRTVKCVGRMLETLDATDNRMCCFDVQISLDGIGDVHDTIRGIPGFFQKVQDTIVQLQTLQRRFPRLNLRLSCVLMPYNLPYVDWLHDFAKQRSLSIHYSPVILNDEYFDNLHRAGDLTFFNGRHAAIQQFFERLGKEDKTSLRFYYRDMAQMVQGKARSRRCMMGFYGFVLEHDGNVYPCFSCEKTSFGNLLTDLFEGVWFGKQANEARRQLRTLCCPTCPSMCYTLPVNALEVAETLWLMLVSG